MSAFTIFVRSLGGSCMECEVTDDTSIESLRQQQWEQEPVPEFYEVRLYHANMELGHGTVRDAGLAQGGELSAVVSKPEQHKHMETIIQLRTDRSHNEDGSPSQSVMRCAAAVRFLGQYGELERATIDALLNILLDGSDCTFTDTRPIVIAVGEVFGRICDPAAEHIPRLIGHIPCPEAVIALDEIDNRGEFPRKQKATLMRQWSQSFPIEPCNECLLALSRLVARMGDSRLSVSFKDHLDHHLEEPLGARVYQEAMDILGLDVEGDGEDGESSGEVPDSVMESDNDEQEEAKDGVAAAQVWADGTPSLGGGDAMAGETDPIQEEQADLQKALLLSKADGLSLSSDDVVILRLTRYSQDIAAALCTSTVFNQRVGDAGCKVRPDFSEGIFLVPITAAQYEELGLDLQKHHVLALRSDRESIAEDLRANIAKTKRPRLHYENHAMMTGLKLDDGSNANRHEQVHTPYTDSPTAETPYPFMEERVLPPVARTFIHFNMREVSEVSSDRVCHSAPAGDVEALNPRKLRRLE